MAAYELRTFQDIYRAVLEELKIQESDTTSLNRVKRDINMVYLNEILDYHDWYWARESVDLVHENYLSTGTVSITADSKVITFSSAPSESQEGRLFKVNSHPEIYKIISHTAGSTTAKLNTKFTGTTNSAVNYKAWDDGLVLPNDCLETVKVWHDYNRHPLENIPDKKFLELKLLNPEAEYRPEFYRVTEFKDPIKFSTISSLPALSTRASSGLVRTLVFDSDVSEYLSVGDFIEISLAGDEAYNGEFVVENVSTTTIQYIALTTKTESATADATLTIKLYNSEEANEVYRKLELYPSLNTEDTTIHVEYIKKIPPLENDSDEPLLPLIDRIALVYGASARAWDRVRNEEMANKKYQLFERKLSKMAAKIQDSTDHAKLSISDIYLRGKRATRRRNTWFNF